MKRTKTDKIRHKLPTGPVTKAEIPGPDGLTDRQRRGVLAILEAPTMEAAAKAAGVTRGTLYEWARLSAFKAALAVGRGELYSAGMGTLKAAVAKAASRLVEMLDSDNENTRRLAARDVLAAGARIAEVEEIEGRIERLEAALIEQTNSRKRSE